MCYLTEKALRLSVGFVRTRSEGQCRFGLGLRKTFTQNFFGYDFFVKQEFQLLRELMSDTNRILSRGSFGRGRVPIHDLSTSTLIRACQILFFYIFVRLHTIHVR
jgi:hypothetical protein